MFKSGRVATHKFSKEKPKRKIKILNERVESGLFDTQVVCTNKETGEVLFETKNKMVITGALFILQKAFNANTSITPPTLDSILGTGVTPPAFSEDGLPRENIIQTLCVGLDGSGDTFGSVVSVDYKSAGIAQDKIVPLRYVNTGNAVGAEYCLKKVINGKDAYYGKRIVNKPTIHSYFKDGTPVTSDINTSSKQLEIETYIEIRFEINRLECREFFKAEKGGVKNCRINTVAFYYSVPVDMGNGVTEMANVKCFSKINFNNEALDDDVKELDFVYRIFVR